LAKPNYQFEKRQRDIRKKQKQEEKRLRKAAGKTVAEGGSPEAAAELPEATKPENAGETPKT
jgi:hypothetical protein